MVQQGNAKESAEVPLVLYSPPMTMHAVHLLSVTYENRNGGKFSGCVMACV